eukprot:1855438-Pleurochrysis_carterae.AAC.1
MVTPVLLRALAKHGVAAPAAGTGCKDKATNLLLRTTKKRGRPAGGSDSDAPLDLDTVDLDSNNADDTLSNPYP